MCQNRRREKKMNGPERILLLNISGIGDFVDSTPALRHARQLRPNAWFTLVVAEKAFPLARCCPYVNEVISLPTSSGKASPKLKDSIRWLRGVWQLRRKFDIVLNLYAVASRRGMWWSNVFSQWCGTGRTITTSNADGIRSGASHPMDIVSLLAETPQDYESDKFELWLSRESLDRARDLLSHIPENKIVVFLGGERRTRHESSERAELWLSEIQRRWGVIPVIIGTSRDPGLLPQTTIRHTDLRDKCNIEETAAIVSKAAALITTHSAPQHFASVWQIPTVVIVGPGDVERYHPNLQKDRVQLLRNPVDCSPCYYDECPWTGSEKKKCITGIAPEAIVLAFEKIFAAPRSDCPQCRQV